VVDREETPVGTIEDILFIQENDLLVVRRGSMEFLIPFTESICVGIDLEEKRVIIDPPEGLLDLDEI